MKLIFSLFTLLFISITVSAQNEADYDVVFMDFTEGYNYLSPKRIFKLLDSEYQKVFTMEKVEEFIEENDKVLGMIEEFGIVSEAETHKTYLTEFENSSLLISLELSADNKITNITTKQVSLASAE